MALAVTHILIPIVVLSLFRFYYNRWQKKITIHEILVAGIFGLLPDIDFPIDIIFSTDVHRIFTHTFIIPLILVIIGFLNHRNNNAFVAFVIYGSWITFTRKYELRNNYELLS